MSSSPVAPTRRQALASLAALSARPLRAQALAGLRLVTGNLPPFAIQNSAGRPGVLIELVQAVFARAGLHSTVTFLPWARAQREATSQPRVMLLPQTRTPAREAQFQWLLPLTMQHFSFMSLAHKPRVDNLDQAKQHKVGVLRGSPHAQRLQELGFDPRRVVLASGHDDLQRMLKLQMVDAIYGGELIALYSATHFGQALQVGHTVESGEVWLAAGSGILPDEQRRMAEAHAALEADRLTERLFQRYGLALPQPREPARG